MKRSACRKPSNGKRVALRGINNKRAGWARTALKTYKATRGTNGIETDICDLIADLLHLCDKTGVSTAQAIAHAQWHHEQADVRCRKCKASFDLEAGDGSEESDGKPMCNECSEDL